jgi:hypothetical protein
MFESVDDIYNFLGQKMFEALPENWDKAWIEINLDNPDRSISMESVYQVSEKVHHFDIDIVNGQLKSSGSHKAFFALYRLMQTDLNDEPWNKARFEITSEGDFEVLFKFDKDFAYLQSLDPDKDQYPTSDEILAIESWEGLPEGANRSWK